MASHCTQLKFEHPDAIAPGVADWIEANPVLSAITEVIQITTAEPVAGGLQVSANQPSVKYVFNFIIFWISKELPAKEKEGEHGAK